MKNIFNYIVTNFGFDSNLEFSNSLIHKNLIIFSLPLAASSSIVQTFFGLEALTIISFVILVTLELITGLTASKLAHIPIVSPKFGRFGLKLGVWITLMFVVNSFKLQYKDIGGFDTLANLLFTWLHGTLFIYVNLEYLISVLENLALISGKKNDSLIKVIKKKFFRTIQDSDEKDPN
tara:strand:- start:4514 stop:5047 length:534 start_codon:yes stop_codon:yes gene_type:complete